MHRFKVVLAVGALALATPALAGAAEDFTRLQQDAWAAALRNNPTLATQVGVTTYDRQLAPLSLAEMDRQAAEAATFLQRLQAIPAASLSPAERTNHAILRTLLSEVVEANRFGHRQLLYSTLGSYHDNLASLGENLPLRTRADYDNYLARVALVPERMRAYGELTRKAAGEGYVQPCVTLTRFPDTITGQIADDPAKSRFYAPFARPRPASIREADWAALQARARDVIGKQVTPAYRDFAALYSRDVAGRCCQDVSIASTPRGREYYAYLVRQHTTLDLTPDQIHAIGVKEVARIRSEMEAVAKKAGFPSREAMIEDMRTNPKWFAKTPEELLEKTAWQAKQIDGKMPGIIGSLARLPYGIRPMNLATAPGDTTARYQPGSVETGTAGFYLVNTTKLDQRPFWEIPAPTVHEAVPGHHQQIALQQELAMPAWRKNLAFFTAFVEGWGPYSERLGIQMGIYDTPQKDMGRLGYEMWRAIRLVVDTGIHAKGWSKERAVQYFRENGTLTEANIDAEVNRYISDPGQALAYKLGELKIRELREKAERELGSKFDLGRFHDAVLGQGSVPLNVLEAQVNAWIAAEQG